MIAGMGKGMRAVFVVLKVWCRDGVSGLVCGVCLVCKAVMMCQCLVNEEKREGSVTFFLVFCISGYYRYY